MRRYEVVVDTDAEDDLFDIYRYVPFNDSLEQADKLLARLKRTCCSLQRLPLRGHIPPELHDIGVSQFREIRYKPYRVRSMPRPLANVIASIVALEREH